MITEEKMLSRLNCNSCNPSGIIQSVFGNTGRILKGIDFRRLSYVEEIRLRAEKPLMITDSCGDWFVDTKSELRRIPLNPFIVPQQEILKTLELMSENSIYAYQEEIRNGYITLKGGHRVGIAGKIVLDGSAVKNIKEISGLNIRLSKEIKGCSDKLMKYIIQPNNSVYNSLIISPPQCGKTTILRDMARNLSDGMNELGFGGMKVGIVDERSEIAACMKGIPQNMVGIRTDILDGCPKSTGMAMMLRSLSPQVIITDEIGNQGDKDAIMMVINAGVKIITSAHGYNISELKSRREVISLINERVFERFIVLSNAKGPGTVEEVIDGATMQKIAFD